MFAFRIWAVAVLLAIGSKAKEIKQRDNCDSGSQQIVQVTFGKTYEVCCPGTSTSVGDEQLCCVGGSQSSDKKREVKRDACLPFCFSSGGDSSSECFTKVPVTASDYSEQVASATAALASSTASGNMPARTTGGSGSVSTSSSNGAARGFVLEPATFHLLAGGAMAAIANSVAA